MDASGAVVPDEAPWKKMSAEELEKQYSPSRWVIRLKAEEAVKTYVQTGSQATRKARAIRKRELHVPYGLGEGEKLDIYFPDKTSAALPFFVFIHGGYWQSGRHPGPDGGPGDPQCRVSAEAVPQQQILHQAGWKASLQEVRDVDHFDIIENLTQEGDVLIQVILQTIFQKP
uniref:kynurenine formamidase isoform X3 n=1 Tax=Jaculus jaculus TaxID=51337 RepID=UPI001E1B1E26|nr:kynurenine formamidase isoform X3 [Jaculus jaculus]